MEEHDTRNRVSVFNADRNQANCGLTIIRVRSVKSPELITHNDLAHLPVELRTGLPVPQPV